MDKKVFITSDRYEVNIYYNDGEFRTYYTKYYSYEEICSMIYNEVCIKEIYPDGSYKINQEYEIYCDCYGTSVIMYDIFTRDYDLEVNKMTRKNYNCNEMREAYISSNKKLFDYADVLLPDEIKPNKNSNFAKKLKATWFKK